MKKTLINTSPLSPLGTFMLLQETPSGYKNMAISSYPEMTQFVQEIPPTTTTKTNNPTLKIHYLAYGDASQEKSLEMPLQPNTESLEPIDIELHSSPTRAFIMPTQYNDWFTSCFGYRVLLVYISPKHHRRVQFQDMQPIEPNALTRFLCNNIPFARHYFNTKTSLRRPADSDWKISFADCAPYLFCSQSSLDDVSARLPPGMTMNIEKFRPNVVVQGAADAFQEDYWRTLRVNGRTEVLLPHNCVRCKSINLDYTTGRPAEGPEGEVLKRLQKDRRIDVGAKWSPVFGRYAFWGKGKEGEEVWRVGDRVNVTKLNEGLTVWSKCRHERLFCCFDITEELTLFRLAGGWIAFCKMSLVVVGLGEI